jgi:hypothetical protein
VLLIKDKSSSKKKDKKLYLEKEDVYHPVSLSDISDVSDEETSSSSSTSE